MTTAIYLGLLLVAAPSAQGAASSSPLTRLGARLAVELGIGPYRPQIDREFAGRTPYKDLFGSRTSRMYRLRLHYFIPIAAGDLGLALGTGFFTNSARSLLEGVRRSAGKTRIRLFPVSALARISHSD